MWEMGTADREPSRLKALVNFLKVTSLSLDAIIENQSYYKSDTRVPRGI